MPHRIAQEYNNMKLLFSRSALSDDVTRKFISINELCKTEIARMHVLPITSGSTAVGKNYMVFRREISLISTLDRLIPTYIMLATNLMPLEKQKLIFFLKTYLETKSRYNQRRILPRHCMLYP